MYRHLLLKPKNLSYDLVAYNNHEIPLVQSDFEKLKGEKIQENDTQGNKIFKCSGTVFLATLYQ